MVDSEYEEDFDDIYAELPEVSEQIEELMEAVRRSVKQEILDEVEQLREENESLREFRDKKYEYEMKLLRLQKEYEEKLANVERERFNFLTRNICTVGYAVDYDETEKPKCDKCNADREIEFFSPSGQRLTERCECARKNIVYKPKQVAMKEFCADQKGPGYVYFVRDYTSYTSEYRDIYVRCKNVYEKGHAVDYEQIDRFNGVFMDKSDCNDYCKWLMREEAEKKKANLQNMLKQSRKCRVG